jgi:ACR3 family arsenite transporter
MEVAQVNLPVGLLIWVMVIPMLMKVDFAALGEVRQHMRGIGVTLVVNWLVKPFSMAFLGWLFIALVCALAARRPDRQLHCRPHPAGRRACTAMVFVWSRLTGGDPLFTLSQVALNDSIMVRLCAAGGALLGMSAITVPWDTLLTSVVLYIVIPCHCPALRRALLARGQAASMPHWHASALVPARCWPRWCCCSPSRARPSCQPLVIALLAVPILIQVFFNSGLAYWLNRAWANTAWPAPRP